MPRPGRGPRAVAEQVAALDGVRVENRGGHPQRLAVAEPQAGADPRRILKSAYVAWSWSSSEAVRWLTQMVEPDNPAATTSLKPVHLGQVGALRQRQVQRDPLEPRPRVRTHQLGRRPQLAGGHAVARHAGQPLEHEPGVRLAPEQVGDVLDPADGVDQARVQGGVDLERAPERSPRGQHQQVAVEALRDVRQLVVRPDRERVPAEAMVA